MLRNNKIINLPWNGEMNREHFVIKDSKDKIIAVVPDTCPNQELVASFILNSVNRKAIKDETLDKLENVALVFGTVIILLMLITIMVDIDYSPMLILGGGILTSISYIHLTRKKSNVETTK